jgi:hypothetical protein
MAKSKKLDKEPTVEELTALPKFKGSSSIYVAFAEKEDSILCVAADVSLAAWQGAGPARLTLRFLRICETLDQANSLDHTPFSVREIRMYRVADNHEMKVPGAQLNKLRFDLCEEPVTQTQVGMLWGKLGGSAKIATWLSALCDKHGFQLKCSVSQLASEISNMVFPETDTEFVLNLPDELEKPKVKTDYKFGSSKGTFKQLHEDNEDTDGSQDGDYSEEE